MIREHSTQQVSPLRRGSPHFEMGPDAKGRRRRRYIYAETRKAAADRLRDEMGKPRHAPLPSEAARLTTGQFLDAWLAGEVALTLRPATAASYTTTLRQHVIPILGQTRLQKLHAAHVQRLLSDLKGAGASDRLLQYVYDVLAAALASALKSKLIETPATQGVRRPRAERRPITVLTAEQVRTLLRLAEESRLHGLITFLVTTGAREGEALGLGWSQVDLDGAEVRIERQLPRPRVAGALPTLGPPKTTRSRRTVSLAPQTVAVLRAHRARQAADRLLLGAAWSDFAGGDLVFPTVWGGPANPSNIRRDFRRLLERAGLPLVPIHALRHTCGILLMAAGVNPKAVSEQLGHYSVGFTLQVYGHVLPDEGAAAARRLGALLSQEA